MKKVLLSLAAISMTYAPAEAYIRTKSQNCLNRVCTRIVLDWNGKGEDVCFAHNSSGKPVLANVDVYPFKTFGDAVTTQSFPLAKSEDKRVFAWLSKENDWRKESCVVKNVQQRLGL
jgi:hypothetical protein